MTSKTASENCLPPKKKRGRPRRVPEIIAVLPDVPSCVNCKFFLNHDEPIVSGVCRRFPSNKMKSRGEWCGEHAPA